MDRLKTLSSLTTASFVAVMLAVATPGEGVPTKVNTASDAVVPISWADDEFTPISLGWDLMKSYKPKSGLFIHLVRPGETLHKISSLYRADLKRIRSLNGIPEGADVRAGSQLMIP